MQIGLAGTGKMGTAIVKRLLASGQPVMMYWQTLSEALSLLQPLGLDPARVVDILADASGGPNMLKARGLMIAEALAGTADGSVSVDRATMSKDLCGMRLPLAALTLKSLETQARGHSIFNPRRATWSPTTAVSVSVSVIHGAWGMGQAAGRRGGPCAGSWTTVQARHA
jgi:3-hydroxyisobutyrate dehydrogenase-like beta-hydroxyacid dehydrogenase